MSSSTRPRPLAMTREPEKVPTTISNVLAVALVSEFDRARAWYERLLDRPTDRRPMDGPAVWQLSSTGGLQINDAPDRAGGNIVIGVADFDACTLGETSPPRQDELREETAHLQEISMPEEGLEPPTRGL
jgi:hypothetical protein